MTNEQKERAEIYAIDTEVFLSHRKHNYDCESLSCCCGKCQCTCGWQSAQDLLSLVKELLNEKEVDKESPKLLDSGIQAG